MRIFALTLYLAALVHGCSSGSFAGSSSSPNKPAASPTAVPATADASGTAASTAVGAVPPASGAVAPVTPIMTPPTNAIVKGSFTIWPVPNHPAPGQDYVLYCQITLPAGTVNYSPADITGRITGTDGYYQVVGAAGKQKHQQFQTNGSSALLSVDVPGSYNNVVDSMTVSSTLLNETQTTSLMFGY